METALIHDTMSEKILQTAERLVTSIGTHSVTVRKILTSLGITNRVFYNRFHNVNEVLEILYHNTVLKMRESISTKPEPGKDFFEHVTDVVASTLVMSYRIKMQFNQYVFENDSMSDGNYAWWQTEIKKLIHYAKEENLIKDVDPDIMAYSIWCFCRGYNADAVGRNLPLETAEKNFRYSFGFLLDGLKR